MEVLSSQTAEKEFILDSKGSCFLCLRSCSGESVNSKPGITTYQNESSRNDMLLWFSLRNLSRYLRLGCEKQNQQGPMDLQLFEKLWKYGVVVNVCEECDVIAKEFNELYGILQETKLRLLSCTQRINDIVLKAGNDEVRVQEARIRLTGQGDGGGGEEEDNNLAYIVLLETLREEMVEKGHQKLLEKPRVQLKRLNLQPATSIAKKPKRTNVAPVISRTNMTLRERKLPVVKQERASPDISEENNNEENVNGVVDVGSTVPVELKLEYLDNAVETPSTIQSDEMELVEQDDDDEEKEEDPYGYYFYTEVKSKRSKLNHTYRRYPCPYCKGHKNRALSSEHHLTHHLLRWHSEHFFPNLKVSSINDLQYRRIINLVLFQKFIKGNACVECGQTYNSVSTQAKLTCLKNHLVRHHLPILKDKLVRLQEDPQVIKRAVEYKHSSRGTKRRKRMNRRRSEYCPCGEFFPSRMLLLKHQSAQCQQLKEFKIKAQEKHLASVSENSSLPTTVSDLDMLLGPDAVSEQLPPLPSVPDVHMIVGAFDDGGGGGENIIDSCLGEIVCPD